MGTFVIAGGTKGIGAAIARQLLCQSHEVLLLARETPNDPSLAAARFIAWDFNATEVPPIEIEKADGAVYCPGSIRLKPFHRIGPTEFAEDWQLNAHGATLFLQALHKPLTQSGGASVVLFSTVAVQQGMPFHSSIAMAKGAIEGLGRSLAAEWAPKIRVNVIAPSLTQTPLAEKLLSSPEKLEAGHKRHPMGRVGQADDHANLACFLLSEKSSWMSGQVIGIDGGMSTLRV